MGKPKNNASSSATPSLENGSNQPESETVRIIFQGQCPKLTPRGTGELTYEIGIETETDTPVLRIAGNTSSGAFNHDWVEIDEIRSVMEKKNASVAPFSAIIFQDLFSGQSSNNHGYLAAILKAEGVLTAAPDRPTALSPATWEPLLKKIEALTNEGISLTDHIAIAAAERARKKALFMSKKDSIKAADENINDN